MIGSHSKHREIALGLLGGWSRFRAVRSLSNMFHGSFFSETIVEWYDKHGLHGSTGHDCWMSLTNLKVVDRSCF